MRWILVLINILAISIVRGQNTTAADPPPPPPPTSVDPPPPPPPTSVAPPPPPPTSATRPPASSVPPQVTTIIRTITQVGTISAGITSAPTFSQPPITTQGTPSASSSSSSSPNSVVLGVSIGLVLLVLAVVGILIFRNGMGGLAKASNDTENQGHELAQIQYQRRTAGNSPTQTEYRRQSVQTPQSGYNGYFDAQGNFTYDSSPARNNGGYL